MIAVYGSGFLVLKGIQLRCNAIGKEPEVVSGEIIAHSVVTWWTALDDSKI